MRLLIMVAAVLAAGPVWSDDIGDLDFKMMGAAAYALAARAEVGGQIGINSPTSASIHVYGLRDPLAAWKVGDCTFSYRPSTSPQGRVYTIFFRNLTGDVRQQGSTLIFTGVGNKPAICIKDGSAGGCQSDLVMQRVYNINSTVNNTLYVLKHGCAPNADDLPGNRDPY